MGMEPTRSNDRPIVWLTHWLYYQPVQIFASANHVLPEGTLLHWKLGEFSIRTNHPQAGAISRSVWGLHQQRGNRDTCPADVEELKLWVTQEYDIKINLLTVERPPISEAINA